MEWTCHSHFELHQNNSTSSMWS